MSMMVLVRLGSCRWRRRSVAGRRRVPDGRLVTDGGTSAAVRHAISAWWRVASRASAGLLPRRPNGGIGAACIVGLTSDFAELSVWSAW